MKNVSGMKMFRQGDVTFRRIESLPSSAGLKEQPRDGQGRVVVAHSETGHHHAFEPAAKVRFFTTNDPRHSFLQVEESGAQLKHHREHDTHEAFTFDEGTYEVIRPREYTGRGEQRMVAD